MTAPAASEQAGYQNFTLHTSTIRSKVTQVDNQWEAIFPGVGDVVNTKYIDNQNILTKY